MLLLWAALAFLYLLVSGVKDKSEIIAAVASGLLVAALFTVLARKSRAHYHLNAGSLPGLLLPIPVKVIKDTSLIVFSVGKWILRGVPIEGFIHRVPYRPPQDGSSNTRIALITAVSTLPPNTIIIGYEKGEFIVHQLVGPPIKRREGELPL